MTRRTARFAPAGAAVVATAALLYERALPFTERVYRRRGTPWIHEPPLANVLGFELSPTEAVIWFIVLGAIGGAVLGVLLARVLLMGTRVRSIVLEAVAGGAVGLAVSLARPTYCIGGGDGGFDAVFACLTSGSSAGMRCRSSRTPCGPLSVWSPGSSSACSSFGPGRPKRRAPSDLTTRPPPDHSGRARARRTLPTCPWRASSSWRHSSPGTMASDAV